jgi:hypothetical protein
MREVVGMRIVLIAAVVGLCVEGVRAEAPTGNGYDVLARVVRSFEGLVFGSGEGPRALEMALALNGRGVTAKARAAFEYPDKWFLDVDSEAGRFRIWRDGEQAWVEPSALAAWLPKAGGSGNSAKPQEVPLLNAAQLEFLPALLRVENPAVAEMEPLGDASCRVVTFSALPELAKSFGWEPHRVALWLDGDDTLRRIEIQQGDRPWVVDVKRWRWASSLPPGIWRPSAEADAAPIGMSGFSEIQRLVFPGGE